MLYDLRDTIVAVASPPGGAARGIVRLSGPQVVSLVAAAIDGLGIGSRPSLHVGRRSTAARCDCALARDLPALIYLWPTTRSYTRQPAAELHTLGSPPLLAAAVEELCRHGARPAAPGEFTLRAFLAGRIDLTQAEAVLGVIDAHGERATRRGLGTTGRRAGRSTLGHLREALLDLLARLEAGLDFSAEDIEFITAGEIAAELTAAAKQVEQIAAQIGLVRRVGRGGPRGAGRSPQCGQEQLVQCLGRHQAIVSDQPGTTRDYLTARLDFGGVPCELIDTAGWSRPATPSPRRPSGKRGSKPSVLKSRSCVSTAAHLPTSCVTIFCWCPRLSERIVVVTKHDLPRQQTDQAAPEFLSLGSRPVETSVYTGHGLDALRQRIAETARTVSWGDGSSVAATAARAAHSVAAPPTPWPGRKASTAVATARS